MYLFTSLALSMHLKWWLAGLLFCSLMVWPSLSLFVAGKWAQISLEAVSPYLLPLISHLLHLYLFFFLSPGHDLLCISICYYVPWNTDKCISLTSSNLISYSSLTSDFFYSSYIFNILAFYRDGREYEAQHVMVTPSIGYLKKNLNMFSPPLPTKLENVSWKYYLFHVSFPCLFAFTIVLIIIVLFSQKINLLL